MPGPDAKPRIIRKVGLALFEDKKIMLVRDNKNDKVFYAVGGKVEPGETDCQCLIREVKEELNVDVDPKSISFIKEFLGPAHGKDNTLLNISFYKAALIGQPVPTEEIVEIGYFDSSAEPAQLSEIAKEQFFPWFKAHGYIN